MMRFFLVALTCYLPLALQADSPGIVAYYAVDTATCEVLLSQNHNLPLVPASTQKIITTAAALEILTPDMQFETALQYDGEIDDTGTLEGNLYITGGGDPCLGSGRPQSSLPWEKQLDTWAEAIKQQGITKITGHIIGDDTRWEKARAVPGWQWEDLGNYYGAGASALSFNENCYKLTFTPGNAPGTPTTIAKTDPPMARMLFHNEVLSGPENSGDRAWIFGCENFWECYVRGTVPCKTDSFTIRGSIPNPATLTADLLTTKLRQNGIKVEKIALPTSTERKTITTTLSPPLSDIVHVTNQVSHNLFSEHLLKKLGEATYGYGSTDNGIKALISFLDKAGINTTGMTLSDGSGLSRKNFVTAKQLADLLLFMSKSKNFPLYLKSLPLKNGMHLKSGSMSHVLSYAGYHNNIALVIIINNTTDKSAVDDFFAKIEEVKDEG